MADTRLHLTPLQRFAARLLLAIYVPVALLSAVHVHPAAAVAVSPDCELCATSTHHPGHISAAQAKHDACLSCRFWDTPALLAQVAFAPVDVPPACEIVSTLPLAPSLALAAHPSLRAPPHIL